MFKFTCAPRLALEFLAQLVQQLRQAGVGSGHHAAVSVVHRGVGEWFDGSLRVEIWVGHEKIREKWAIGINDEVCDHELRLRTGSRS